MTTAITAELVGGIYDGRIVPFRIANLESGNLSRGHRFMSPDPFPVANLEGYLAGTRDHFVIVDPAERKRVIRDETEKAAATVGGRVLPSEELLETVTFLTEYPTVVCGNFDREYLKLPQEVLITTMISTIVKIKKNIISIIDLIFR